MSDDQLAAIHSAYHTVVEADDLSHTQKTKELFRLFQLVIELATEPESISFTTLFSRLAYIGTRDELPKKVLYQCHYFRRQCELELTTTDNEVAVEYLGRYVVLVLLNHLFDARYSVTGLADHFDHLLRRNTEVVQYKSIVSALILEVDLQRYEVSFIDEAVGDEELTAYFDVADRNEIFTRNIKSAGKYFEMPLQANFLDVSITSDGRYEPGAIVLMPDYLIDVTAIAECFSSDGVQPMSFLLRKFMPRTTSIALMVGNIVNQLLDDLVSDPSVDFVQLREKIFRIAPLQFALCSDEQVREILQKCYSHFLHMKHVVNRDFKDQGIYIGNVYLEPSFYSQKYGIQGRLDLLHLDGQRNRLDIVELKSGKPWRPNKYGLSHNHYTQTLLYDMMMHSVYDKRYAITPYILYSVLDNDQLKFAPPVKAQQYESIKVRNDIISLERQLGSIDQQEEHILHFVDPIHIDAKGFVGRDVEHFAKVYRNLTSIERAYFDHFTAFVAREHRLAKTGEHGLSKRNGLAALWLENREEKEDRFAILANLELLENHSKADPPRLVLKRTSDTHPLANFRAGDIAVLYPAAGGRHAVLHNQILKCSIIEVTDLKVVVKLRSKQYNQGIFRRHKIWHVEEDMLDSSFNGMYRSLFSWADATAQYRSLYLGKTPPREADRTIELPTYPDLTVEQQDRLTAMVQARDYFLLWGPPGTGKTSMMLRHYVQYLHEHTDQTVLIMAYTNRAVDEICQAIEQISSSMHGQYLRLGSRHGCGAPYADRLLTNQVEDCTRRSEIIDLVGSCKIYVSTVSSVLSNVELLSLVRFDTAIIDEASQILEPMLAGLLHSFGKWVMIGDHKQLPAVVRQRRTMTLVDDPKLKEAGVVDCGMSLFERLYHTATTRSWDHAIGILGAQGRMHESVMAFPNQHFYGGRLQVIDHVDRLSAPSRGSAVNGIAKILGQHRCIYIPCRIDGHYNWKVNRHEATVAARVIKYIREWYSSEQWEIAADTIGVITPYRAQIAQIKDTLIKGGNQLPISIDTVERYQGGARDIIVVSLCTNRLSQLDALINHSVEGIDRKLNVALTRAREQVIIIGNEEILEHDDTYAALIKHCYRWKVDG